MDPTKIDRLGELDYQIKKLEKQKNDLLETMQLEVGKHAGNFYQATVFAVEATLLDKDKVKALLSDYDYMSCLKKGKKHNCVRISPKLL